MGGMGMNERRRKFVVIVQADGNNWTAVESNWGGESEWDRGRRLKAKTQTAQDTQRNAIEKKKVLLPTDLFD